MTRRGVGTHAPSATTEVDTDALIASYLDEKQLKQVRTFATTLLERNKHMNLTGALTVDEVLTRHVADSLALIPAIESALGEAHASSGSDAEERSVRIKLLDVGSGAGFPGMALAIARPNWNVTLLDTLQKRTTFLADAADACGVSNVTTLWSRAEDAGSVGSEHREAYDLVTARAVAELRVLCELCADGEGGAPRKTRMSREGWPAAAAVAILGGAPFRTEEVRSVGGRTFANGGGQPQDNADASEVPAARGDAQQTAAVIRIRAARRKRRRRVDARESTCSPIRL